MKDRLIFRQAVVNIALLLIVFCIFFLSFKEGIVSVFSPPALSPYYRGSTQKPQISLMVNVYWGTEYLADMLEIFRAYQVKTTFFVGGSWVDKNPDVLKQIVADGHEIGNHGFLHIDHKRANEARNTEEILVTERLIESVAGVKTDLFAPPSGSFGEACLSVCQSLGYRVIMWSRDTVDWRDKDASLVYKRCTNDIKNGELILMHPTAHTVKALSDVLAYYQKNGFTAVPVSQCLAEE